MARQAKDVHQKHQAILSRLLKDDDNKYCVDCDAKGPRWASWNLGVFLCIRCAGIHRNLGVHISKVKSINLDSWTPEQIASVEDMGNSKARAVYEANLPDNYKRPSTSDSAMEQFIRAKYEHKKYIAKEWVPSKPRSVPSHYYDNDEQKKEPKKPVKTILKVPGAAAGTSAVSRPAAEKKTPAPVAATAASKPEQSPMVDLSAPANTGVASSSKPETTSADLLADIFTSAPAPSTAASTDLFGMSAAPQSATQSTAPQSTGQQSGDASEDLFKVGDEKSQTAKDSIMALFGNTPNPQPNMMANSYGMAPGAFAQPTQGMMGVQPQANPAMPASYQYGYQPQLGAAAAPGMGYSMAGQQPNVMAASHPGAYQQYPGMAMGAQATTAGNPAYVQQQFAQQQMQMSMGNLSLNQQVANGMVKQTTPAASFCNSPMAQTNGQTLNGALWN